MEFHRSGPGTAYGTPLVLLIPQPGSQHDLLLLAACCHIQTTPSYFISHSKLGEEEAGAGSDLAKQNLCHKFLLKPEVLSIHVLHTEPFSKALHDFSNSSVRKYGMERVCHIIC